MIVRSWTARGQSVRSCRPAARPCVLRATQVVAIRSVHDGTSAPQKDGIPKATSSKPTKKWSETLALPKTPFELRARASEREALFRKRTTDDLYRWQSGQSSRPPFVLHDGPPYANGELHMGHALNKILKDVICRFNVLIGKRVHFHPGWDCHGLPIEMKIYGKNRLSGQSAHSASPQLIRQEARKEATHSIAEQRQDFQSYAIMADWSDKTTYRTYDKAYVLRQMAVMREMVQRKLIYRAHRPVYWSIASRTALAEAEIEYDENHLQSSVYVRFSLNAGPSLVSQPTADGQGFRNNVSMIIWTTTPWTLPSNMAVNVNSEMSYSLVRATGGPALGERFIVATDLIPKLEGLKIGLHGPNSSERPLLGPLEVLSTFKGEALLDSTYRHPFLPAGAKDRPIIAASYVTNDAGTGFVHSAPGHGHEDYMTWLAHCQRHKTAAQEEILSPVDDTGCFTYDVRKFAETGGAKSQTDLAGLPILSDGTGAVIDELHRRGELLTEIRIQHRYPIDWRTKTPVVVRCTSQWFANLEPIRKPALRALEKVTFTPASGRARLEAMVRHRDEWCISRQRVWGVPIPVVYDAETDEPLLTVENMRHIERVIDENGIDYWWQGDAVEFVTPSERKPGKTWRKGQDIVDVWFDSGTSWTLLRPHTTKPGASGVDVSTHVADVYCEGTDQHRGWFQSSLLTFIAMGATGTEEQAVSAPYKNILTHGFILDPKREKMSKSRGNVMRPSFFINGGPNTKADPAYGVDVLRMWAARGDPTNDVMVSALIVKHASEALRNLRTSCRFLLSVLPLPHDVPLLQEQELGAIERYVLGETYNVEQECRAAYEQFDLARVIRVLSTFHSSTLSSLYFDISKDILYADAPDSPRRKATLAVFDQILRTMTSIFAPILPHLAEEVHHFRMGAQRDPTKEEAEATIEAGQSPGSMFEHGWQSVPQCYNDEQVQVDFKRLLEFRSAVMSVMERGRQAKVLKRSLGVDLDIQIAASQGPSPLADTLKKYADVLADVHLVSSVRIVEGDSAQGEASVSPEWTLSGSQQNVQFVIRPALKQECPRCRTHSKTEHDDEVCSRCHNALHATS